MKTFLRYNGLKFDMLVHTLNVSKNQIIIFHDDYKLLVDNTELHWNTSEVSTIIDVTPINEESKKYLDKLLVQKKIV